MSLLVLVVLILSIAGSDATWCVCRSDLSDPVLQKTLDYACGAGADCLPIHQKGACFDPDTVRSHCSYAANSFFQKNGQTAGSCDFSGTATISTTDPSYGPCSFPATASAAGAGITTTPTSNTPISTIPGSTLTPPFSTSSSNNFTPITGGIGPSGTGFTTDGNEAGLLLRAGKGSLLFTMVFSALVLLRGR